MKTFATIVLIGAVGHLLFSIAAFVPAMNGQAPPVPVPEQQPLVIRHTNLITNVTVSVTTTISEVTGIRVDGQFIPRRTNLLFKTSTNLWSSTP